MFAKSCATVCASAIVPVFTLQKCKTGEFSLVVTRRFAGILWRGAPSP